MTYFIISQNNEQFFIKLRFSWLLFGAVVILTIGTRFYKVTEPDHVWLV